MNIFEFEGNMFRSERELANHYNIPYATLRYRLQMGMPLEEAIKGKRKRKKGKKIILGDVEYSSIKEAAKDNGISLKSVYARVSKGEDLESAITRPTSSGLHKSVTIKGVVYKNRKEAAKAFNISPSTITNRINKGWDEYSAITTPTKKRSKSGKTIYIPGGPYTSIKQAALSRGNKPSTVYNRISAGIPVDIAIIQQNTRNKKIECEGKKYPTVKSFALSYGIPLNQVYRRLKWGWEPERIVKQLTQKQRFSCRTKIQAKKFYHIIVDEESVIENLK